MIMPIISYLLIVFRCLTELGNARAHQWYPRETFVACNADHAQIAKLKRGENSIYPSVRWAIKKALLSAGDLYSEAKGTRRSDPSHSGGLDESSILRQSVLQVSHHQSPMISNGRSADPTSVPSRPPPEDDIDQQTRRLHQAEINQSDHSGETQSKTDSFNEAVAQWQFGIDDSKQDDTWSSKNPSSPAGADIASVVRDEDGSAIKTCNLTLSLDTGAATPRDPSEQATSDGPKIERSSNETGTFATKDSNVKTHGTKSMIMNDGLASAIVEGDEQRTRELLEHSYHIECKYKNGATPLLFAARHRHENMVRMLLEHGADLRARSNDGLTALHRLALFPTKPISETLIDLILQHRPPLDASTKFGQTPLMIACQTGESLLAKKLILHGADVRAVDRWGQTPLHYAASNGKAEMIPLLVSLLDSGVDFNASDWNGETSLHKATRKGHLGIVKTLLDHGANPTIKSKSYFLDDKASTVSMMPNVSSTQKKAIRSLLKEAEKVWKQSNKK